MSTTKISPEKKKRSYKNTPTLKQIKAAKLISENLRKKGKRLTTQRILKEAGYSDSVAKAPQNVTESLGFKELLDKYLPEALVTQTHGELLAAGKLDSYKMDAKLDNKQITKMVEAVAGCKVRKITRFKGDEFVTVYFWYPDGVVRKAAIDMAYKLRGSYAPEKHDVNANFDVVEITNFGNKNK